ncbi:MAG: hypothetical protein M1826_005611 [Phylliscum demangeonii]|nr:MAG: hypothetical protein M1826_005611 [Phylliscum demangeonii]
MLRLVIVGALNGALNAKSTTNVVAFTPPIPIYPPLALPALREHAPWAEKRTTRRSKVPPAKALPVTSGAVAIEKEAGRAPARAADIVVLKNSARLTAFLQSQFNATVRADDNAEPKDFQPRADVFAVPSTGHVHVSRPCAMKQEVALNDDTVKSPPSAVGEVHRLGDEELLKTLAMGAAADRRPPGNERRSADTFVFARLLTRAPYAPIQPTGAHLLAALAPSAFQWTPIVIDCAAMGTVFNAFVRRQLSVD